MTPGEVTELQQSHETCDGTPEARAGIFLELQALDRPFEVAWEGVSLTEATQHSAEIGQRELALGV